MPQFKVKLKGYYFYVPSDTLFFNEFSKIFVLSAKEYAPDINVHCHIFDATQEDINWCKKNNVSVTSEKTPSNFISTDEKKAFWVNIRFCRITDIFDDSATVMSIDADSVIVNNVSLLEFIEDTKTDWVTLRQKGTGALGGCVCFSANSDLRYLFKRRIESCTSLEWYLDQAVLDDLLSENLISTFTDKYLDCFFKEDTKIWSGKGKKKYFTPNKKKGAKVNRFAEKIKAYRLLR